MKHFGANILAAVIIFCMALIAVNRFARLSEVADRIGIGPAIVVFLIIVGLISLVDNLCSHTKSERQKQRRQADSNKP